MTKKYIFFLEDTKPETEDWLKFEVELSDEEVVTFLNESKRYFNSEEAKKYDDLCGEEQWMIERIPDIYAKIMKSLELQADEILGKAREPLDQYNIYRPEELSWIKEAYIKDGQLFLIEEEVEW